MRVNQNGTTVSPGDSGFSLAETIVAAAIIVVVILAFALFMTNLAATQSRAHNDTISTRILSDEMEQLSAASWDDLMLSGNGECQLGTTTRRSAAIVVPGPQTIRVDGLDASVSRTVTWTRTDMNPSPTPVTCANTPNDRDDLKTVTVTVTWNDPNGQKTKQLSTYRSRWA